MSIPSSAVLTQHIKSALKQYNINIQDLSELSTGVDLADLVNHVLYGGNNQQLTNKIIRHQRHRKGNNIINLNIILKTIKNDSKVKELPEFRREVQSLTAFVLMDDPSKMNSFINWILEQASQQRQQADYDQDQPFSNVDLDSSPKRQSSGLENLYFAADISPSQLKSPPVQINDSLDGSGDKVVKKGSFKILKPKPQFNNSPTKIKEDQSPSVFQQKKALQSSVQPKNRQPSERKTIPKMSEKPPICRLANKQNTKSVGQKQQYNKSMAMFKPPIPTPFNCDSSRGQHSNRSSSTGTQKNEPPIQQQLKKDLQRLDKEIIVEKKALKRQERSFSGYGSSTKKVFKLDIKEVSDEERKEIVHWLISINLLNSVAVNYYSNLHQICRNGVIFPEIINYQRGRGAELCYFREPKRGAELNANYQKVFNYLKDLPNFNSDLMFMYEYFIPEAQERSFWSFIKSMYLCFAKLHKRKEEMSLIDYQCSIKKRFPRTIGTTMNQQNKHIHGLASDLGYQRIKYGSSSQFKQRTSHGNKSQEKPRHQSQKKERCIASSKRKSSEKNIEFIKELPPQTFNFKQQLIQKEEPNQCVTIERGYRDLHQRKSSKRFDTPKKSVSAVNTSMSRSRILSMGSIRKSQQKIPPIPSINLDMQMKALCYLKQKAHSSFFNRGDKELFKDPLRNGVLINQIIIKDLQMDYVFYDKPKNIQECRENYRCAISNLKKRVPDVDSGYLYHVQEIIKGDKSLFYGLISCIASLSNFTFGNNTQHNRAHPLTTISKSYHTDHYTFEHPQKHTYGLSKNQIKVQTHSHINSEEQQKQNQILMWIRSLQQYSPAISMMKIRDLPALMNSVLNSNFLYALVGILEQKSIITPNYNKPTCELQQQSNLKKVFSFLVQYRIIDSDYLHKVRNIVKKDVKIMQGLLEDLMAVSRCKLNGDPQQTGAVTFVKYLREDQKLNKNSQIERLDTTMANQSHQLLRTSDNGFINPNTQIHPYLKPSEPDHVQVKWIRKLGFSGNLAVNNGVVLCQLIERLTMKTIQGVNYKPQSRAECLMNVRRGLKAMGGEMKWDQNEILDANSKTTLEVYKFIKEKYKHAYALKFVQ